MPLNPTEPNNLVSLRNEKCNVTNIKITRKTQLRSSSNPVYLRAH